MNAAPADDLRPESAPNPDDAGAKTTGRGGLALAGGKIYFLVTGLVQQVALKQVLGLAGYGAFSTASSLGSIWYNPLVQAGIQGVSRETAVARDPEPQLRRLLEFHAVSAAGIALFFFLCAGPLTRYLGAPHVANAVRVLSAVLFIYGIYAAIVGFLNGRRRFLAQASLDVLSATLRTAGLVLGAFIGMQYATGSGQARHAHAVTLSMVGFVFASVIVLAASLRLTGWGRKNTEPWSVGSYAKVLVPIWAGQLLFNVLFQADGLLLRRFAASAAAASALPLAAADPYVGAYRASQLFCFLPFQLLTSITFVLFPLLARAKGDAQPEVVRQLIERGLRISMLLAGAIVSVVVAVPEGLLTLVFQAEAAELASQSMRVLAVGMGFFALLGVTSSALNSLGEERRSLTLIALAVVLVTSLCVGFARDEQLSPALLTRVATATSLALIVTSVCAGWVLFRVTGAAPGWLTLLRTLLASGGSASVIAAFVPAGPMFTLLGAMGTLSVYWALLSLLGELTRRDWHLLRAVFRR